jgi:hypothetical protein
MPFHTSNTGDFSSLNAATAAKAYIAFGLAFATALLAQVADKTEFGDLTVLQWLIAVVSALVTAGAVYTVPNRQV